MRSIIIPTLLLLATPAWAQQDPEAPAAPALTILDPTAENAVVDFGATETLTIEAGGTSHPFTIEIARTEDQTRRGLMWREEMAADAGMLFVYPDNRVVSIWMQNTILPLDLLYVRADGTIAKIVTQAQPGSRRSHSSDFVVAAVLEIPGGSVTELGITVDDIVRHNTFNNVTAQESSTQTSESEELTADDETSSTD
jgi:uncharacterized membrane protein (UPF0127 family)